MRLHLNNENVAYHAARLLLLIELCGKPRGKAGILPGIEGRTLLAKLDFFLRYPSYLRRALDIHNVQYNSSDLGVHFDQEEQAVESRMIKYLYGPWDHLYYVVLAYLIGKELISVELKGNTEVFRITAEGHRVAKYLENDDAFADVAKRARVMYKAFNRYSGNGLKDFIYQHFPEVVKRDLGAVI